jgi:hypothetical protein
MNKKQWCMFGATGRYLYLCLGLALAAFFLGGCGGAYKYGSLQYSPQADQKFEKNQLIPNYTYYYSGFQRVPYGIIGIDNNYSLRPSRAWRPFELDPTILNQLKYRMAHVYSLNPRGSWILDHEGNRVGIWYSSQNVTKVRVEKNRQIMVASPEPPDLRGIP